jgi:hypothetical protein
METQDAVIALDKGNLQVLLYRKLATWQVCSTFWLDRSSDYRNLFGKKNKSFVFDYSLKKYPEAKVLDYNRLSSNENKFDLDTNQSLFSELTNDPSFWCQTCTMKY